MGPVLLRHHFDPTCNLSTLKNDVNCSRVHTSWCLYSHPRILSASTDFWGLRNGCVWCSMVTTSLENLASQGSLLELENIHNQFCKQIIVVGKLSTNLAASVSKLPPCRSIMRSILNYWFKNKESLLYQ